MICNRCGAENHNDKIEILKKIDESEIFKKVIDTSLDEFKKLSNKAKVIVLSIGFGCFGAFLGYGLSKSNSR